MWNIITHNNLKIPYSFQENGKKLFLCIACAKDFLSNFDIQQTIKYPLNFIKVV